MENQPKPSKKSIMLNNGIIAGVSSIIIGLINFSFGDVYDPHWAVNVISILIVAALIVLGIKKVKELNNGLLSIGEALKTGIGIALISALFGILYIYVFSKFIEPGFIDNIVEINREKMIEGSREVSDEMLDKQAEMTKEYFYVFTFGMVLLFNLFIGFVISLITGLVMKKSDEEITSI